jgi:hypothetical protein
VSDIDNTIPQQGSGREEQKQMKDLRRKWVAPMVIVASVLLASAAMGAENDPCYQAYLDSGLNAQQMSLDQFRLSYTDTLCKQGDEASLLAHQARALRESR